MSDETKEPCYFVRIKDMATGQVSPPIAQEQSWGEGSEYWWSEGNFSCDCNRCWEFERGLGRSEEQLTEDPPCHDPAFPIGRFRVHITSPAGEVLYSEMNLE